MYRYTQVAQKRNEDSGEHRTQLQLTHWPRDIKEKQSVAPFTIDQAAMLHVMVGFMRSAACSVREEGRCQGKTCEQEIWVFLEGRKTQGYRKGLREGRDSLSEEVETETTSREERKGRSHLSP